MSGWYCIMLIPYFEYRVKMMGIYFHLLFLLFCVPQTYSFPSWSFILAISFAWNTLCIAGSFSSIRSQLTSLSLRLLWPRNPKQLHQPVTPQLLPRHLALFTFTTIWHYLVHVFSYWLSLRLEKLYKHRDLDPLTHQYIPNSRHRAGTQIFVD